LGEDTDRRTAILVDPHPLWIDAVEHVVSAVPVEVVAKLSSLEEAQEPMERMQPDVIVAEIALGGDKTDGLAWLQRTRERFTARIIVLTACADPEYIDASLAAGAWAYVLKTAHPDDLKITIRQAFEHSIFLPSVRSSRTNQVQAASLTGLHNLTHRELEILALVAEGHSNAKMAKMLWVTEQTVKFHLSNIYRKLEVSNRTEASRWAQIHGFVPNSGNVA
jgi:DNA-binding NarL/FixJ family response regulator